MSYKNLEVWKLARDLSVEVHQMSVEKLPKFEMYEEGSQIRPSTKSVRSNIVEGYGRRHYKGEFVRYLVYAEASCDESMDHLETLHETRSLTDSELYEELHGKFHTLAKKLNRFLDAVRRKHAPR